MSVLNSFEVSELCNQLGITLAYHVITPEQQAKIESTISVDVKETEISHEGETYKLRLEKATHNGKFIRGAFFVNGELHDGLYMNERDYNECLEDNF
jgi:hypothetical protein